MNCKLRSYIFVGKDKKPHPFNEDVYDYDFDDIHNLLKKLGIEYYIFTLDKEAK